jgi:hypothetical protein
MSAARRKAKKDGWLANFSPARRFLLFAAVMVFTVASVGCYMLWQRFGSTVLDDPQYVVTIDKFDVTAQPDWIHAAVNEEVFRDASWDRVPLSLLDREVTLKVAQAFQTHSWVAKVHRVTKYPAGIHIDLTYRQPVAMVEVELGGNSGLLPVDVTGVLLPPGDFSPKQAAEYPRVEVPQSVPSGPVGTAWGDQRVEGAARIAVLFGSTWQVLKLDRIIASQASQPGVPQMEPTFALRVISSKTMIQWGRSPGHEGPNEAKAAEKITRLVEYVNANGPLDGSAAAANIDLQNISGVAATPRTARRPE